MADLSLAAPALPAAVSPLAGVSTGDNSNGQSSATLLFSGAAAGAHEIPAATFVAALAPSSRLHALFSKSFASQADLDAALAALGFMHYAVGASAFALVPSVAVGTVGQPKAVITTTAATGSIRMSLAASVAA